jgi:hypothetical protein
MPNKLYTAPEATLTFQDSTGDYAISLNNLADGAGRVSARADKGSGSKAKLFRVTAIIQFNATVVAGKAVEIYIFKSDGTYADGTVGTADAAIATDKRRNGTFIGSVIADQTSATVDTVVTFEDVVISSRYFSVGVWNASGVALKASANASKILVTPIPDEVQ